MEMTQSNLNAYAQAAILICDGQVSAINDMARQCLPEVTVGVPAPDYLDLSAQTEDGTGIFCTQGNCYHVRHTSLQQGQLFLFSPIPDMGLSRYQLDSALFQMRQFMGEFYFQVSPLFKKDAPPPSQQSKEQFTRSYHRMLRLMENMECVNSTQNDPLTRLDVVGLWGRLTDEAETLLRENKTDVIFECKWPYLMVQGNGEQLRHLLLELLSNAGRAAKEGRILVKVEKRANRVILTVKDHSKEGAPNRRLGFDPRTAVGGIPLPDSGAGLGMTVAENIVRAHSGSMLSYHDSTSTTVVVSLPWSGNSPYLRVESPKLDRSGGFHPLMVELSDILPSHLFGMEDID